MARLAYRMCANQHLGPRYSATVPPMITSALHMLVLSVASIALLKLVFRLFRNQRLSFRYMMGWSILFLLGLLVSLTLPFVASFAQTLRVVPISVYGVPALLVVVLICIQLSISISGMQIGLRDLAERFALIEHNETNGTKLGETLVVIPAFNEEGSIQEVVRGALTTGMNVLVVNDGSTDRTALFAEQCGAEVLNLPINLGVGGALRAGFKYAVKYGFSAVVQVDADGQHPTSSINVLLQHLKSNPVDMLIGSRFLSEDTTQEITQLRKIAMRALAISASRATGTKITDATSGFRVISEPLLSQFSINFDSNYLADTHGAIMAAGRAGYRVEEVGIGIAPRVSGESTASTIQATLYTIKCILVASLRLHSRIEPR